MDQAEKLFRRFLAFLWVVMRHGLAFLLAILGSVVLSIPSWISPLFSPAHAQILNAWVTISPHEYRGLAVVFFGLALLYACFRAWNEERDSVERLSGELAQAHQQAQRTAGPSFLSRLLVRDPKAEAEERNARATEEHTRELRREHLPDVLALIKECVVSQREGHCRIDIAIDLNNQGKTTSLHGWGLTAWLGDAEPVSTATFLFEDSASKMLESLNGRECFNLAKYTKEVERGRHLQGWLVAEFSCSDSVPLKKANVRVSVRDHLDSPITVYSPQQIRLIHDPSIGGKD